MTFIPLIFYWFSFTLLLFAYALYPIILWLIGQFIKTDSKKYNNIQPFVTILIAAHNESNIIKEKIENCLSLDYPAEKMEIIIMSDGSSDNTANICREFNNFRVVIHELVERVGKTEAQNKGVEISNGEIIIFSDANAMYKHDAIKRIVERFSDDSIGCVSGRLVYQNSGLTNTVAEVEANYWKMESWLKSAESKLNILTGANGSIYALRKDLYVKLEKEIISDLIEPLHIMEQGFRFVYEPHAISTEISSKNINLEFNRKRRIVKRSIYGMFKNLRFLNPAKFGFLSIALFFHKIVRWLTPFLGLIMFGSSIALLHLTWHYYTLVTFLSILSLGLLGLLLPHNLSPKIIKSLAYLLVIAFAGLLAGIESIFGKSETIWEPKR